MPQRGKAITLQFLSAIFHVFFKKSFQYVRELTRPNDAVLESACRSTALP